MGFNSVFNFLKIPSHVYFFFQPCFWFFPCIIFCPIVSFFILLILSSFRAFGLFFFFMPLRIFCPFPLSTICVWLFLPSRFGFSLPPPDMVLSVCLVLSLSSVHTLSYLTIPSSLHAHYFLPNIKQSSLFFVEWDIFFPHPQILKHSSFLTLSFAFQNTCSSQRQGGGWRQPFPLHWVDDSDSKYSMSRCCPSKTERVILKLRRGNN